MTANERRVVLVKSKAVVLVHGWPVTDYHWRHVKPALEGAGARTITWTPPGLGRAAPESTVFTKRAIAAELGEWLDAQNLRDVVLVGHDWAAPHGCSPRPSRADPALGH